MKKSASIELVIHILLPEILYPDSVFVAFVARAKASDPDMGSERQKEPNKLARSLLF
jgi:hypothetical protein